MQAYDGIKSKDNTFENQRPSLPDSMIGGNTPNDNANKFDENVIPGGKLFTEENERDSPDLHKLHTRGRP